ncbi:MAG TPA: nitroreductase family deazaflavin-dependent oxidoreductase [Gaiellaceae bacterium]
MSTQESAAHLFGDEHVRSYLETDGKIGFRWKEDAPIAILFTKGRRTGLERTVPLIFGRDGDDIVVVASKGGAPEHPGWFENLARTPEVGVQIEGDRFRARARIAEGEERERLWELMNEIWPHYDEYAARTEREIPVVVLERL